MDRVFHPEEFKHLNSFYSRSECRAVVLQLYKGKCQSCEKDIVGNEYHVAHIIPRSKPELMNECFPGLNVDNLLNLQLSCPVCNWREKDFVLNAPLLRYNFNCSARVITQRLPGIVAQRNDVKPAVQISGVDPKICTDVLHLSLEDLVPISSDWHGAIVISESKLSKLIRLKMIEAFGFESDDIESYQTFTEAVSYFKDHCRVSNSSIVVTGINKPTWWLEALSSLRSNDEAYPAGQGTLSRPPDMPEGIYLDREEIVARQGLWVPLRTPAQRWFYRTFATLVRTQRMLDSYTPSKRYIVLDEHDWCCLHDCYLKLGHVEAGIGIWTKRIKAPSVLANFSVSDKKLYLHEEETLPEEVKNLCRAAADDSSCYCGSVLSKAKLRTWLSRAFALADDGVQKAMGPHLVRVGGWHWVPQLPKTIGMTLEQVRLETEADVASKKRARSARKPQLVTFT